MSSRDKDLLTFLTSNATWKRYCDARYSGKWFSRLFPAVAPSSQEVHSFTISKATAAVSGQVRKFCFHMTIPGIKLSHHV